MADGDKLWHSDLAGGVVRLYFVSSKITANRREKNQTTTKTNTVTSGPF